MLEIYTYPNDVLRVKAKKIKEEEKKEIKKIIKEMLETMYEARGVGLAGPQVGLSKRIFVVDVSYKRPDDEGELENKKPVVFINPKITKKEGSIKCEEGCLSVPEIFEEVERFEVVEVEYLDENFKEQKIKAEGFFAVAVQHEFDHLEGVLFIDKLPTVKRTMVKKRIARNK